MAFGWFLRNRVVLRGPRVWSLGAFDLCAVIGNCIDGAQMGVASFLD